MPRLTDQGLQKINDLAQHYGVSAVAVMTLLQALLNSKGTMAQFDHRELGGAGQWMLGGMTMVGDMFNHGLKAKVDGLCSELSRRVFVRVDFSVTRFLRFAQSASKSDPAQLCACPAPSLP